MYLGTAPLVVAQMWDHHDGWGGGAGWAWFGFMSIVWIALIAAAVWLVVTRTGQRHAAQPPAPTDPTARAREILAERYARGEIDSDEYRERLDRLR